MLLHVRNFVSRNVQKHVPPIQLPDEFGRDERRVMSAEAKCQMFRYGLASKVRTVVRD